MEVSTIECPLREAILHVDVHVKVNTLYMYIYFTCTCTFNVLGISIICVYINKCSVSLFPQYIGQSLKMVKMLLLRKDEEEY